MEQMNFTELPCTSTTEWGPRLVRLWNCADELLIVVSGVDLNGLLDFEVLSDTVDFVEVALPVDLPELCGIVDALDKGGSLLDFEKVVNTLDNEDKDTLKFIDEASGCSVVDVLDVEF